MNKGSTLHANSAMAKRSIATPAFNARAQRRSMESMDSMLRVQGPNAAAAPKQAQERVRTFRDENG